MARTKPKVRARSRRRINPSRKTPMSNYLGQVKRILEDKNLSVKQKNSLVKRLLKMQKGENNAQRDLYLGLGAEASSTATGLGSAGIATSANVRQTEKLIQGAAQGQNGREETNLPDDDEAVTEGYL